MKEFMCVCGKRFLGAQSYNGHRRHCKVGKTDSQIEKIKNADRLISLTRNEYKREHYKKLKNVKMQEWKNTIHLCAFCGKQFFDYCASGKYSDGRFCSKRCSRAYSSKIAKENNMSFKAFSYGLHGQMSPYEKLIYDKLSAIGVEFIWNATRLNYTDIKGHTYVLDFYFPEYRVDLEYDGRLHKDRVKYDEQRDSYLETLGITTYRIKDYDTNKTLDELFNEFLMWFSENYNVVSYKSSTEVFDTSSEGAVPSTTAKLK